MKSVQRFSVMSTWLISALFMSLFIGEVFPHSSHKVKSLSFTVEEGLPTNLTKETIQDRYGFIWIASDAGLIRYDGYNFRIFSEELPSPYVKSLYLTRDQRLLVVTDLGVCEVIQDGAAVQFKLLFPATTTITDSLLYYPKAIYEDRYGNFWISEPTAIVKIYNDTFKRYRFEQTYHTQSYLHSYCLWEDKWGHLLAFTQSGHLFHYYAENDSFQLVRSKNPLKSTIDVFLPVSDNTVLVGGSKGVFRMRLYPTLEKMEWEKISSLPWVQALAMRSDNELYIGTTGDGVFEFSDWDSDGTLQPLAANAGKVINQLYVSRENSLWVSSDEGLFLITFPLLESVLEFSNFSIQNLAITRDGRVLATDGLSVYHLQNTDGNTVSRKIYQNPGKMISCLTGDVDKIAVGNIDGIVRVIKKDQESTYALSNHPLEFLMFDQRGNLWIAQNDIPGVTIISPSGEKTVLNEHTGLNTDINVMRENGDGTFLFGGSGKKSYLYRYTMKDDKLENISCPLPEGVGKAFQVNDIAIGDDDRIWLATTEGVFVVQDHRIKRVPLRSDIKSTNFKSITLSHGGSVWMGTDQGLYVLVNEQEEWIPLQLKDGLSSSTMTFRSLCGDAKNQVWIGNYHGVSLWDGSEHSFEQTPSPFIRQITNGEQTPPAVSLLPVEFPRGSTITFHLSSFSYPSDYVQYRWRIPGFSRRWSNPELNPEIFLHYLPHGKYTIEFQAQQSGMLWSEPLRYTFRILPPWYLGWKGGIVAVFSVLVLILLIVKYIRIWSERRTALDSLTKLSMAVEQTEGVIFITDATARITYVNPAFQRVYGYRKEEVIGKRPNILKSGKVSRETYRKFWKRILSGQAYHGELINRTKDGKLVHMKVSVSPITNRNKQVVGFIAVQDDISELKRAEEELKHYAADLENAKEALEEHAHRLSLTISELEIARQKAEEANRAKSEFVANMSHEIRTPMNGIIGMTELTLETDLSEEQREYLQIVKSSAHSLLTIINDILDFSKIEAGKLELEQIDFRLRAFVVETIKTQSVRANQKKLELLYYVSPDVPDPLQGDPVRLRQILINLIGNSIKFTEEGEIVLYIGLEEPIRNDTAMLHLAVRDTGIGIPPEKQTLIFEAFAQADNSTTRKFGGTGLGLAITFQLVKLMNGKIWVESPVQTPLPGIDKLPGRNNNGSSGTSSLHAGNGEGLKEHQPVSSGQGGESGCIFHVVIPFKIQPDFQLEEINLPEEDKLRGLPVLVVDDNETNRRLLNTVLGQWGMEPTCVSSGTEALQALQESIAQNELFSVILLDAQMPIMDGYQLAGEISTIPEYAVVPRIMLTSAGIPGDARRCKELGIDAYLTKPVAFNHLKNTILTCLSAERKQQKQRNLITRHSLQEDLPVLHILLVEDNLVNQKVAARILEKMGHMVTVANNGKEGVEAWKKNQFDLILMDVQMPEMDGFEATGFIRQAEKESGDHIPIVAMTAHAMKGDRERCLQAGMDEYIAKPIDRKELQKVLKQIVMQKFCAQQPLVSPSE